MNSEKHWLRKAGRAVHMPLRTVMAPYKAVTEVPVFCNKTLCTMSIVGNSRVVNILTDTANNRKANWPYQSSAVSRWQILWCMHWTHRDRASQSQSTREHSAGETAACTDCEQPEQTHVISRENSERKTNWAIPACWDTTNKWPDETELVRSWTQLGPGAEWWPGNWAHPGRCESESCWPAPAVLWSEDHEWMHGTRFPEM